MYMYFKMTYIENQMADFLETSKINQTWCISYMYIVKKYIDFFAKL